MATLNRITPCLWFDTEAEEAAALYTSIFENSRITQVTHYGSAGPRPAGMVLMVNFELEGQEFIALNGGPEFTFDEAVSFLVTCESQEEIDELWDKLVEGGGEHGPCGWLKDRYGLSWQIVPSGVEETLNGPDKEGSKRAFAAMMQMGKIDLAELQRAYKGE